MKSDALVCDPGKLFFRNYWYPATIYNLVLLLKILTNSYEILNLPISNFKDILQESPLEDILLFVYALSKLPKENLNANFW